MPRPLKKSIKNNGMIKVNRKVREIKNKSGRILLRVFCVIRPCIFRPFSFQWHFLVKN